MGHDVRTVGFGEPATDPHRATKSHSVKDSKGKRVDDEERRYVYKNRRAEMYGILARLVKNGFGILPDYDELIRQLKVLPKLVDGEGRMYLPPKDKPSEGYRGKTIKQMLGGSPDEADSLVLAVYGMVRRPEVKTAGVL